MDPDATWIHDLTGDTQIIPTSPPAPHSPARGHGTVYGEDSDRTAEIALRKGGMHKRSSRKRIIENILMSIVLLAGVVLLAVPVHFPVDNPLGVIRVLALMMSGACFMTFIFGVLERILP